MSHPRSPDNETGAPEERHGAEIRAYAEVLLALTRRKVMTPDEAEEFRSWAMVRFLEDDCAVLRAYAGRSSLTTFLRVVAHNALRDYRIAAWGKWRPSAAAKRLGDVAVRLEQLVYRDGCPPGEAFRALRDNHGVQESEAELEALLARLPRRYGRARPTDVPMETVSGSLRADAVVAEAERAGIASDVAAALAEELGGLDAQDRLLLRLRFEEGLSVATISRSLGLEQKPLYRRFETMLARLRKRMESHGCGPDEVRRVWSWHGLDLSVSEPGNPSDVSV